MLEDVEMDFLQSRFEIGMANSCLEIGTSSQVHVVPLLRHVVGRFCRYNLPADTQPEYANVFKGTMYMMTRMVFVRFPETSYSSLHLLLFGVILL